MTLSLWNADKRGLPSRHVTEGVEGALHRMFYYGLGLTEEEIHQPHVGIATAWRDGDADVNLLLAERVVEGVWQSGATPRRFHVLGRAPGGDDRFDIIRRELVADSVELAVRGHCYDAVVGIASDVAGAAGLAMATCRLDVPSVVMVNGTGADRDRAIGRMLAELGLAVDNDLEGVDAGHELARRLRAAVTPRAGVTGSALERAAEIATSSPDPSQLLVHLIAIARECGLDATIASVLRGLDPDATRTAVVSGTLCDRAILVDGPTTTLEGPAIVADSVDDLSALLARGKVDDSVVVMRGFGPKGFPGPATLSEIALAHLQALRPIAVVSDGLLPRLRGIPTISAAEPEAVAGGAFARIVNGDRIAVGARLDLLVDPAELVDREPLGGRRVVDLVGWKHARLVTSAHTGASTHPGAAHERARYAAE